MRGRGVGVVSVWFFFGGLECVLVVKGFVLVPPLSGLVHGHCDRLDRGAGG